MLNASNAVENQKVSICRLSDETKDIIARAMQIAVIEANNFATKHNLSNEYPLPKALTQIYIQLKESKEIWLIES